MNFRTRFSFKPFLSGLSKPEPFFRHLVRNPAVPGATLTRRELRRMVADMID